MLIVYNIHLYLKTFTLILENIPIYPQILQMREKSVTQACGR